MRGVAGSIPGAGVSAPCSTVFGNKDTVSQLHVSMYATEV